ncbi:glycoside hydrolase family 105 protein [Epithele typhae]|uniref:glycoside hydrolase family 105 protein n=1 Tax=Epithele typhae TaxID=378194 RepID=UPI0020081F99|nr:glycoside hydrolase family 105 protein [Epithele typhae]KAH9912859.1 glycoside hydrolase family 105 protein [Epithele typhae]
MLSLGSLLVSTLLLLGNLRASFAKPSSYAVWAADSAITRGQGNGYDDYNDPTKPVVSYEHGELQWGLMRLYSETGNKTYYDYILDASNVIVYDNGSIISDYSFSDYSLDPVRTGPTFVYLYQKTRDKKWKTAADTYHTQLMSHPRTAQGQFWHKKRYPNQGWLDGIYMGDVFYTTYVNEFQPTNSSAYDDIELQFKLMYENTLVASTHLLYHGYDYSHTASWASSDRGHSPEVWDRAIGWYLMALVDIIEIWPAHRSDATFRTQLKSLAPAVAAAADPDHGVWWLVLSQAGRSGNYFESSGAAMFVYALLKGVRLGYLDDADGSLTAAASRAFEYMVANWVVDNGDGTMDWLNTVSVGSLSGDGSFAYYIAQTVRTNDLKGQAAFLLAALEYEKL